MPYIRKEDRVWCDGYIDGLVEGIDGMDDNEIEWAGQLNYIVSKICWDLFDQFPSYAQGNKIMGVLVCAAQEFYRRKMVPYEEKKIKENGDL